ncbi:MAG TPA: HigA family addiction module antitoxin [Gillisia sp.]|nr:HigA family addiction module antitoxin [Gillisia sp.]
MATMFEPLHPGEVLREEFIDPLELTITATAKALNVSRATLSDIVNAKQSITPDMALRLSKAFNTTPEIWVNMQRNYDLAKAKQNWSDLKKSGGAVEIQLLVKQNKKESKNETRL